MNSRERVLKAIRFEQPDLVPIGYNITPDALLRHGQRLVDLCRKCPTDFYDVDEVIKIPEKDAEHYQEDGTYYKEWTDEWGCLWVFYKEGISGEVKQSPIDDWRKLKDYRFPAVHNASPTERKAAHESMQRQKENYVGWGSAGSLFEQMQWLRGVENLMMDLALDVEDVYVLADRMMDEWLIPNTELALEAGAEVIQVGDDWGSQTQLLINPKTWRGIFKPRYKKIFDLAHQGGALTWMHSDGMILEILPDLIEMGLDVINPQFSCMDLDALHEITDHKLCPDLDIGIWKSGLCIYTDIDRQCVLPYGTPEQVREYVQRVYERFHSPDGGLIWGAGVYGDVTFENAEALLEAFKEFR